MMPRPNIEYTRNRGLYARTLLSIIIMAVLVESAARCSDKGFFTGIYPLLSDDNVSLQIYPPVRIYVYAYKKRYCYRNARYYGRRRFLAIADQRSCTRIIVRVHGRGLLFRTRTNVASRGGRFKRKRVPTRRRRTYVVGHTLFLWFCRVNA